MSRLGEEVQIFHEQIGISSGTSGLTNAYSMEDCSQITFVCGLGTVAAAATAITPTFSARQSADVGLSTNAAIGGATAVCGPTTASQITNARSVLITLSSASTDAETMTLNGYTLTQTTVGSATVATALTFGATAGTTSAAGLADIGNSLSSVINNSTMAYYMTAATASTASVRLTAKDTASTGITIGVGSIAHTVTSEKSHSIIEVRADDLNSTSKYVGLGISTATTSVTCGVTVIKSGLRNAPPYQSAQAHKKST